MIESLRDIGYSLETALADIIDNSITAGATEVEILTESGSGDPYIAIVDDGRGMTRVELIAAMRLGSQNPLMVRERHDLGRFGLGLKSASFSQCRRLTVVSRKDGLTAAATWDLDIVAERNEWAVALPSSLEEITCVENLGPSGTLVVWQKLDRLSGGVGRNPERWAALVNRSIAAAEYHLRLVFHRFLGRSRPLMIALNGRRIDPLDPFATQHPATISLPVEELDLEGGTVRIQSYTLPHRNRMSARDWEEIGGPGGHLNSQGFYLYRGERLIRYATWFNMARRAETTKLARVMLEIPNSMDSQWRIDVRKSSAELPPLVRDRLKRVIERIHSGSKDTFRGEGSRLVEQTSMPLWHRFASDGMIRYRPNSEHPVLESFAEKLSPVLQREFQRCVSILGASLPIETLHHDFASTPEGVAPDSLEIEALQQVVEVTIAFFHGRGLSTEQALDTMKRLDPFRSAWPATQRIAQGLSKDN
jgi:hypothetical protein